jgi:hypothetical protein
LKRNHLATLSAGTSDCVAYDKKALAECYEKGHFFPSSLQNKQTSFCLSDGEDGTVYVPMQTSKWPTVKMNENVDFICPPRRD